MKSGQKKNLQNFCQKKRILNGENKRTVKVEKLKTFHKKE